MDSFMLTDGWTAISASGASSITQPSAQWLDLPDYEDIVFFLDVKEVNGAVTISYESGPTCDDQLFVATIPPFAMTVNAAVQVDRALFSTSTFPFCRYLRWKLSGPASWDCCFRIWIAAYTFGRDDV